MITPDLKTAVETLTSFCGEHTLTKRIAGLQKDMTGLSALELSAYLAEQDLRDTVLDSALTLKAAAAQISVIIHATGILLALPFLLEPDETIEYVSLGAGNTGKEFDLETDRMVAEFKFTNWQGGSESIRQNQLFKDFFYLAEYQGNKRRCLYVVGKAHPLKFLRGHRALTSVLSKNETLRSTFFGRYGDRFSVVSEYYSEAKNRVEIHDLGTLVPSFQSL